MARNTQPYNEGGGEEPTALLNMPSEPQFPHVVPISQMRKLRHGGLSDFPKFSQQCGPRLPGWSSPACTTAAPALSSALSPELPLSFQQETGTEKEEGHPRPQNQSPGVQTFPNPA